MLWEGRGRVGIVITLLTREGGRVVEEKEGEGTLDRGYGVGEMKIERGEKGERKKGEMEKGKRRKGKGEREKEKGKKRKGKGEREKEKDKGEMKVDRRRMEKYNKK